ncbi:MAG: hypothetical protein J6D02_11335 [Lachnospira sp.]|nr:hypothetical protein [Lachnospira sp.]
MHSTVCRFCGEQFEHQRAANFIVFCPNCKKRTYLECEYGFGPIVPCSIFVGVMKVGEITYADTRLQYRLDSDVFQIHRVLHHGYKNLEAYEEAIGIIDDYVK